VTSAYVCEGRLEYNPQRPTARSMLGAFIFKYDSGQQRGLAPASAGRRADLGWTFMKPSEPPARELTLEEAVTFAILLQKNQQFAEAGELYAW